MENGGIVSVGAVSPIQGCAWAVNKQLKDAKDIKMISGEAVHNRGTYISVVRCRHFDRTPELRRKHADDSEDGETISFGDDNPSQPGSSAANKAGSNDARMAALLNEPSIEDGDDESVVTSPGPPLPGPGGVSLLDELGGLGSNAPMPETLSDVMGQSTFPARVEPVGGNATESRHSSQELGADLGNPERVFKVVFVGDSGVGKTCFIHRFCLNRFKSTFSATIGVNFQVKSMMVEDHCIALQLWDTAGQERFRSITKQYFRKADGVVLMYDVTSELSFINLRNWFQNVKDGVEEGCVLCLIGNKIDLCETEASRVLKYKDGLKLADEFGALFYEASASSGDSIQDCMHAMALLLREREDKNLEKALRLNEMEVDKKSKCCGRK